MRRLLLPTFVFAALGLSAVSLMRAAAAPDPFYSDGPGLGFGPENFGSFPGLPFRQSRPRPAAQKPAPAKAQIGDEPDPALARRQLLDDLFKRLKASSDDVEAQGIAGAI